MSELMERLDNLRALIQEPEFLEGKGLSNEVNIRIFCYDPKDEMAVRHFTEKLMTDQSLNCHLIEYNLYKVFLSICNDKRITDRVAGQEEKKGKQFVLDQMKRMANNMAFIGKMPAVELLGLRRWKMPCTRRMGRVETMAPPPYWLLYGRKAAVDLFPITNRD